MCKIGIIILKIELMIHIYILCNAYILFVFSLNMLNIVGRKTNTVAPIIRAAVSVLCDIPSNIITVQLFQLS